MRGLLVGLISLVMVVFVAPCLAHEPIFGLGPHTIYKGGVGVEAKLEGESASGGGEEESEYVLHAELIYGITADLAATLAVPYVLDRARETDSDRITSDGPGDVSLRAKYRFWRRDALGVQDAAAFIAGIKLPSGDDEETPKLGTGSTDYLLALTAARESLIWYYFFDTRNRINGEDPDGLKKGNTFFADLAVGIRVWEIEYLAPDLVVLAELNWESAARDESGGADVADSGGDMLFLSPSFFLTYRNLAAKGGVQLPLYQDLNGEQPEVDYRFSLALEFHL